MDPCLNLDPAFLQWLNEQSRSIKSDRVTAGGCIADSRTLLLDDESQLFIKQMVEPVPGLFKAEAAGLVSLAKSQLIKTPAVLFHSANCLVLEYLEAASRCKHFDEVLGRQLAALHSIEMPHFGFEIDTFCGATRQLNTPSDDGYQFYAEQRFIYLAEQCSQVGYLASEDVIAIETICSKLSEIIPYQKPVLLHGDLWSGNVHVNSNGHPVLIDPAVYYGWAEADLAMTKLFGGFSTQFYGTYQEVRPLDAGWDDRMALYNLWHLMNHLLLFGEGYLADVKQVIQKYA